jgi:hypothetical protein
VGDVRAAGGDVFPDPIVQPIFNPYHALMFGLTPVGAAEVFLKNGRFIRPK